jgi:hypothetical protein
MPYRENSAPETPQGFVGGVSGKYQEKHAIDQDADMPSKKGESAARAFLMKLSEGYEPSGFSDLAADLVKIHRGLADALSDIDTKKYPDGGALVVAYGLADQNGTVRDHQGVSVVVGSSLVNALDNIPDTRHHPHRYIWIGKKTTPVYAPKNILTIVACEYVQHIRAQINFAEFEGDESSANKASPPGEDWIMDQHYRRFLLDAISLEVPNPKDQAAVAVRAMHEMGNELAQNAVFKLSRSSSGRLFISEIQSNAQLNIFVEQAIKGDLERISIELTALRRHQEP